MRKTFCRIRLIILILGIGFLFLVAALAACSAFNQPRYEVSECQFFTESSREFDCGYILVPEDRSQEDDFSAS